MVVNNFRIYSTGFPTEKRPESLENIINIAVNIAVKIDDRQHYKFVEKKWSKPIPQNKPRFNIFY